MNSLLFYIKITLYELKLCFSDIKKLENIKTLNKEE